MKITGFFLLLVIFLFSCNQKERDNGRETQPVVKDSSIIKEEKPSFFPVTSYLKGQLFEIKNGSLNPVKIVTIKNKIDSSWIKMELLENEVADFLSPEIDSVNMISLFKESKFLDQTLDAVTLTYDPINPLPDSVLLKHWDIYINPETGEVKRLYMLKKLSPVITQQLTWQVGKSCSIVTISEDEKGNAVIEKEVTIKWSL